MFYKHINEYPTSNKAFYIANENRYHSYTGEQNRPPEQRPERPAELPRNDKTAMRVSSQILLGTANELIIQHDGREYRLRLSEQSRPLWSAARWIAGPVFPLLLLAHIALTQHRT